MRNKVWRSVIAVSMAAAMTAGLAGCSQSDSKKEDKGEGKKDVTITVAASQSWIADIDRTLAEEFTEKTGIKVDYQLNPDDQYTNIVKAKLASGEGPDIFYCNGGNGMQEYMPEKYFTDLSKKVIPAEFLDI